MAASRSKACWCSSWRVAWRCYIASSRADTGPGLAPAGHDGQRQSKIAKHSKRNPCSDCPQSDDGACVDVSPLPELCRCRFCRTAEARLLARVISCQLCDFGPAFLLRCKTSEHLPSA